MGAPWIYNFFLHIIIYSVLQSLINIGYNWDKLKIIQIKTTFDKVI